MYKIVTVKARVRVPPEKFGEDIKKSIEETIRDSFEGYLDKNNGLFLKLLEVGEVGDGIIIPGDGAVYYDINVKMLLYKPELQEIVEGKVEEITEFGAFVRIGPIDGIVHVSQVMDDFVSYSKSGALMGRDSKKVLKVGDKVRARIFAVSLKSLQNAKIGLTMRQPGLGKLEWLE